MPYLYVYILLYVFMLIYAGCLMKQTYIYMHKFPFKVNFNNLMLPPQPPNSSLPCSYTLTLTHVYLRKLCHLILQLLHLLSLSSHFHTSVHLCRTLHQFHYKSFAIAFVVFSCLLVPSSGVVEFKLLLYCGTSNMSASIRVPVVSLLMQMTATISTMRC